MTTDQLATYTTWYNTVESSGVSGVLLWQAGSHLPFEDTPQDGYTVCLANFPDRHSN